jgi:hypothetical protein
MAALGQVNVSITADTPYYAVLGAGPGRKHVAFNPEAKSLRVHFSDGAELTVPARAIISDSKAVLPNSR